MRSGPRRSRSPRIGLFGMYSSRNLGDTAIQQEVIANLRARLPGCDFVGISADPEDAVATHRIDAVRISGYPPVLRADGSPWRAVEQPWPEGLKPGQGTRRILAVVRELDLLVMSGGGQLEDFWYGPADQPRYLLTWTLAARALGVPVVYFGVGLDQLTTRLGGWLVRTALASAHRRVFRDQGSVDLLRAAGLRGACEVVPDPALGITPLPTSSALERAVVVVSPISYRTWRKEPDATYDAYLAKLAAACTRWIQDGLEIRFLCSQTTMDPPVVEQLIHLLSTDARTSCEFVHVKDVNEFRQAIAATRFVVASRLHGAILALSCGTPVIAISPARKVTRLMEDCGLSRYCLPLKSFTVEDLLNAAHRVDAADAEVRAQIEEVAERARTALALAYDSLASRLNA